MKKLLVITFIVIASFTTAQAQEVGVRFGDISGGSVAVDGMISIAQFSRVHLDASFGDGFGLDALWDFLYRPLGGEAFNWYAGVGPYFHFNDPFGFGVAGEIGLEYRFASVPIALGIDWRPRFRIVENTDFEFEGFGFNVRYVFGAKTSE